MMSSIPIAQLDTRFRVFGADTTLVASLKEMSTMFGEDPEAWVVIRVEGEGFRAIQVGHLMHIVDQRQELAIVQLSDARIEMDRLDVLDHSTVGIGEANRVLARSRTGAVVVVSGDRLEGLYRGPNLGLGLPPMAPPVTGWPSSGNTFATPDRSGRSLRGGRRQTSPPTAIPPSEPVESTGGGDDGSDVDARRLGVDILLDDTDLHNAFVVGREHTIRVSIGHSSTHRLKGPLEEPDFRGADHVDLPVWANAGHQMHSGTIRLPSDTTLDATKPFEFPLTPGSDAVAVEIVVYQPGGNSVLQAALLSGDVATSTAHEMTAEPTIALHVVEVDQFTDAPESLPRGSVVHTDSGLVTKAGATPIGIDAASAEAWVGAAVSMIEQAAAKHELLGRSIEDALVKLAFAGNSRLATHPRLRDLEPFDRIQVVSLTEKNVLPLELLYSGEVDRGATICTEWKAALEIGSCTGCDTGPPDGSVVCPLRFWSMSKAIEHHGSAGDIPNHFLASGLRTVTSMTLDALGPALVGVSRRVTEEDANALDTVRDSTEHAIGPTTSAANWTEWVDEIARAQPGLLVAIPHQGIEEVMGMQTAILELGGTEEIVAAAKYVTTEDSAPGPVVILLGCDTAAGVGPMDYSSAALFRAYGAAIVVSSLGKVLATTAPDAAVTLIQQLAAGGGDRTFGEAFLAARRTLLSQSNLVALMLVSHGDNEWRLD